MTEDARIHRGTSVAKRDAARNTHTHKRTHTHTHTRLPRCRDGVETNHKKSIIADKKEWKKIVLDTLLTTTVAV